jgi:hypothetical protein
MLDRALDDTASDGRDTQGSEPPRSSRLGNPLPSARARSIPPRPQVIAKLYKKGFAPAPITNPCYRHPVDPGGPTAVITGNLAPGASQVAAIGYPIPHSR